MVTPDIAMAASARDWPDRLHRFILDHGGGRVVNRVMSTDQATGSTFDVLLIDDVCSFLSPRLVSMVKKSGREVIGVYLPEDGSDAKRRLLECGISDVIETEASPEEFLSKVRATLSHRVPTTPPESLAGSSAFRIGVTGACEGVGITEISIALARSISRSVETVLVDLDPNWPSVAQRLDLPLHPNIRTAIDHALHRPERFAEALQTRESLSVLGGRADGGQGAEITRADALMLMDTLGPSAEVLVADLGPMTELASTLIREFDTIMLVGTGTPVGVARLVRTAGVIRGRQPSTSLVAVANKTSRGGFHRSEVVAEIGRALPDVPVVTLPIDSALEEAAWNGTLVGKGRFNRAVDDVSRLLIRSLG
jgi:MinD-like ATPase involved in chromosome partitioning or flagellar assembly